MENIRKGYYTKYLKVMFSDIDWNGHVNNKHYCSYCDESIMHMFDSSGIDLHEMSKQGIGPITHKAEYEYKGELKYGDRVKIISSVKFPKKTRAIMEHSIYNATTGELACRAVTYGIWINLKTKRLHKLPDEILEKMLEGDNSI